METVCQLSYPLNSENASPFGPRTVYLAWPVSCAEVALLPRTASTETASETTTITTAGILLLFIATLLVVYLVASYRKDLNAARSSVKSSGCSTGEVPALVDLVEVDQAAIRAPGPCLRGSIYTSAKREGENRKNKLAQLRPRGISVDVGLF